MDVVQIPAASFSRLLEGLFEAVNDRDTPETRRMGCH
jgi:hypothetical protein